MSTIIIITPPKKPTIQENADGTAEIRQGGDTLVQCRSVDEAIKYLRHLNPLPQPE